MTPAEKFRGKVSVSAAGACWEWHGRRRPDGYGLFFVDRRYVRAHRFAWELDHGPIPAGMVICHRCDNPPCCNPAHLFLGTRADNNADKVAKGRSNHGERHGMAKLDERQVLLIRESDETPKALASRLGISRKTVHDIRARRSWKRLDDGQLDSALRNGVR